MDYTVYVLESSDGRKYKGMTSDLNRRLREHKSGSTKSTKNFDTFEVIYTRKFPDRLCARAHENILSHQQAASS